MKTIKIALTAALLAGSITCVAHADSVTDRVIFCNSVANFTEAAAKDRDAGYTAADLLIGIEEATPDLKSHQAETLAAEVREVYTQPYLEPTLEGRLSFHNCLVSIVNDEYL